MKILLLNQAFHPDVVATAQYLSELAVGLVDRGHEVTVLAGRRAYDDPTRVFPAREMWKGIRIVRVGSTGLGKDRKWRRAIDFASFMMLGVLRLARLPRADAIVALTSPPLICFAGACLAKLRGSQFFYWVMDLNPDEALAAGWLSSDSVAAKLLEWMSRFSFRQAARIIVLDRFMRERVVAKGIPAEKVAVIAPWAQDESVRFDPAGRAHFREAHRLQDKFVVMYSGNHSPCHPLDTVLAAARKFAENEKVIFCFIGGGSEWRRIRNQVSEKGDTPSPERGNILLLPYQPTEQLSASLSAADLHVVVMGEKLVGLVHPCKIYNLLQMGAPVLYIGPKSSHISEILADGDGELVAFRVSQGDVDQVVTAIHKARRLALRPDVRVGPALPAKFSKDQLLPRLIALLVSGGPGTPDKELY